MSPWVSESLDGNNVADHGWSAKKHPFDSGSTLIGLNIDFGSTPMGWNLVLEVNKMVGCFIMPPLCPLCPIMLSPNRFLESKLFYDNLTASNNW